MPNMKTESYFQYRCYNDHPFIKEKAEELFQRYQADRKRKITREDEQKSTIKAFKTALAGMYLGDAFDAHGSYVRLSLNKNNFYGNSRLSPVFQPKLYLDLNWLIDNGIIIKVAESHFNPSTQKEIPRGYRLAEDWLNKTQDPIKQGKEIKLRTSRNRDAAFIELRDEKKRCKRLSANRQKPFSLNLLKWYESELNNHSYTIGKTDLPSFYFSLTRIYSRGSYELGGRFYSLFQSFGSQTRLHLKIDGESVFEVDLSSLHPTMLYRMAGKQQEPDPYTIDGYPRSVVKVAMQVLLNTIKPFPPSNSLRYFLSKAKQRMGNRRDPVWQAIEFTNDYCERLAQAIASHNKPIAQFFCQGIGLKLQHKDSVFTSCVLHYMMRMSPSSVVIPIHDSYIIKQSEINVLLEALAYAEAMMSKLNEWELLEPKLKVESITIDNPNAYESTLDELATRITTPSIKEEILKSELQALELDQDVGVQSLEDAYDLDAGIEEEID